ncbi:MAG: HAD-IB family hydrolase [Cellvibrionales bacterium]|nr:HAD-IB family hydrolase [Cellvibrionales bacterium]
MALAIFDLDETLIAGDSDALWGEFVVKKGLVTDPDYDKKNHGFHVDYMKGELDIFAYLHFCLKVLSEYSVEQLHTLREEFFETVIDPLVLEKGIEKIQMHREQGDFIMIISATNCFVVDRIAERFGVDKVLATNIEIVDGAYTGKPLGTPCFREGKIENLNGWLKANTDKNLNGSYFYSDSRNDIPLLSLVDHPIAIDPDDVLKAHANANGWQIQSFKM